MISVIRVYQNIRDGKNICITKYKNLKVETLLEEGQSTLYFSYPPELYFVECEDYLDIDGGNYVVKEISPTKNGYKDVVAKQNLEALEKTLHKNISLEDATIEQSITEALKGTGWGYTCTTSSNKKANIHLELVNAKKAIDNIIKGFCCEVRYDNRESMVYISDQIGENKGRFFLRGINVLEMDVGKDTYDYCTRLYPIGKDGLTISEANEGIEYIQTEAPKVVSAYWEDSTCEDANALLELGRLKLKELCTQKISIKVKILDLANIDKLKYSRIYSFDIGDWVRITEKKEGIDDYFRIVKITHFPNDTRKNEVEVANKITSFSDMQKKIHEQLEENKTGSIPKIVITGICK